MRIEAYQIVSAVNCRADDGVVFMQAFKGLINNAAGEVRKIGSQKQHLSKTLLKNTVKGIFHPFAQIISLLR